MSKTAMSRRNLLKGIGAGAGFVGVDLVLPRLLNKTAAVETYAQEAKPWYALGIIGDDLMDERLLWFMSHTWERMADLGECLDTASRIEPGSSQSWMREWFATADRVRAVGDASLAKGHRLSAGECYLRATNYYLAGLMYGESPDDPEIVPRAEASRDSFVQAFDLLGIPGEYVEIPYEDSALPAYFFRSPLAMDKAPVLIVHQGMDASVEENLWLAQESIKRGYHALLFHHPGQGLALRLKGLTFRPDWENVITPVIDWTVAQPEVDPVATRVSFLRA